MLLAALLALPVFAVPDHRAQIWKPQRMLGSSQLSLDQILYIVRPDSESKALVAAIEDFSKLMEARYGQRPELLSEGAFKRSLQFKIVSDGREGGAFTVRRERTRVAIQAVDAAGWCNGLYAIMGDMLGARWYWAGELGFEWVEPRRRSLSNRPWREEPAFVQRKMYPMQGDFGRRNRLNSVYSFNHNLAKVFTPKLFKSMPEVFAEVNGRRSAPKGHGGTDPQPDFTHPDAVEIAAQAALKHFKSKPESTSYSLSINDNALFDTRARTEAVVSPLRYFRGRPSYTDLVFGFMNQVAERVFDQEGAWQTPSGQDRFLTALAYYWTEPAPSMQIHPRVMPVLTSDRAQWHDADYRSEDKTLIRAWMKSGAERVATWDYYFGAPYLYPRQFNQWIDESLKHMADAGVDVFFSQLPSFWGLDGAKAWLASELLWDPRQDAEQLLAEYYDKFFGAASEPMRAFYEIAENHRNVHEGAADWIKLYKDESGIALFTPEVLADMRHCLDEAEQKVGVPTLGDHDPALSRLKAGLPLVGSARYAARVRVVSEAFQLTELYARYDGARRQLVDLCLDDGVPRTRIASQLETFRQSRAAYQAYFESYLATSEYAPQRRHIDLGQSNPERFAMGVLQREEPRYKYSFSDDPDLKHLGAGSRNFLGPVLPELSDWHLDYRPSEDFKVVASEWGEGSAGLRIEDADIVSVFSTFPVVSNKRYELRMRAAWHISLDNRVHLHINWLDREGQSLESEVMLRLPYGQRDEPVTIRLPLTAPNNTYNVRVRMVVSRQYLGDFWDISELDFSSVN